MKVQQILADAWYFYTLHFKYIAWLCIPFVFAEALLAEGLIAMAIPEEPDKPRISVGAIATQLGLYPIYIAILIQFLQARSNGVPVDRSKLLAKALNLWPTMVLLVVMEFILMAVGFTLFVLPYIWVSVRLAFAEILLVENDEQPFDAMKKSFQLTLADFWPLLGIWLIPSALLVLARFVVPGLIEGLGNLFILKVIWHMALVMLEMFVTVAVYRAWMHVRKGQGA